jgi:hypothetical protein
MVGAELDEVAKDGETGDLGKVLDLGDVGAVEEADEEIDNGHASGEEDLRGRQL